MKAEGKFATMPYLDAVFRRPSGVPGTVNGIAAASGSLTVSAAG
jgi:hypothetical protein